MNAGFPHPTYTTSPPPFTPPPIPSTIHHAVPTNVLAAKPGLPIQTSFHKAPQLTHGDSKAGNLFQTFIHAASVLKAKVMPAFIK